MEPYVLHFGSGRGAKPALVDDEHTLYGPRSSCRADPRHKLPAPRLSELTVIFKSPPNDFFVNDNLDRMISERARAAFVEHGITGWEAEPAHGRHVGARAQQVGAAPPVWHFRTTGWGGVVPEAAGLRRIEGPCGGCGRQVYQGPLDPRALFDPERWDGSDIFMIWPFPNHVWVTPRVAELVRSEKLTGGQVTDLDDPLNRVFAAAAELGVSTWGVDQYIPGPRGLSIASTCHIG